MRFSTLTAFIVFTALVVLAACAGVIYRLPDGIQENLLWFTGTFGGISSIALAGAAIGWIAARRSLVVLDSVWTGIVLSLPNWGFFALVRFTLYLTSHWDYDPEKTGGLIAMEQLASIYFFEVVAVGFQMVLAGAWLRRDSSQMSICGAVMGITWVTIVCLELLLIAISGIYIGGLN